MDQALSPAKRLGSNLCLGGAGLGAVGLVGWLAGVEALVTIVPGQPPMMPNTALAVLLLGFAGALRHRGDASRLARSLSTLAAIVVLVIGIWTIGQYLLDVPFSIDQLFVRSEVGPYPGRPSPPTALALAFLAGAILIFDWSLKSVRPSEWLILCSGLIAFTFAVAQLLGAGLLYRFSDTPVIGVAVPTAAGLLMVSIGLLFERPDSGIMRIVTSPSPGGIMLRRLAPAFILIGLSIAFMGSLLLDFVGSENAAVLRASLTVFGIAVVLPLFIITARQLNRAHDTLEQSRRAARGLIEQASEGIFISNLEGRFVDVNDVGCRMAGYSREEILGKTIADVIPPTDVERLRSHRAQLLEGHTDVGEWKLRRKDGSYLPVEVSAKILPDGRWLAFSRDISERKRAEDTLRQAQERFELALDGAELASWDWNITTGEVNANPRCAEMRGFRPDEIRPHVDAYAADMHPDDQPAFQKALSDCLEGIRPEFECEYRASTKSGGWVWLLSKGKIFGRDERGRPTRMVGTALDITARKRSAEMLYHTQERLDLALKGADLALWDWNVTTGEVNFNPRWAEMRGFRPEEITPHVDSCFAGIHPDDRPAVHMALNECLEGVRADFECEYRVSTKSGEWIWVLDRGKVFARDERGQPMRMVGTELDITARKRVEEALRLSEAKFSGIVSISPDAIISIDEDQRITLFNGGAEKIYGYSMSEVIGAPIEILVPERLRANHRRGVENFAEGPEITRQLGVRGAVILGLRKNDEEFQAAASISKLVIDGKKILTVALRDITEQKHAETEDRILAELGTVSAGALEFEDRLPNLARLLARDFADLCIVDVVDEDGSIRRARVASRDPTNEWLCDVLMQMPRDRERPRVVGSILETGQAALFEKIAPELIGWAEAEEHLSAFERAGLRSTIVAPLMVHGKVLGMVSLLSLSRAFGPADLRMADAITQRAALLLDNARLFEATKRAVQARDEMLGVVAHDLRNPLEAIAALAAVVRMNGADREVGDEIDHAVNRMDRLIQDLIDVTRIEGGHRLSLGLERIDATAVISDTLKAQTPLASSAALELRLDIAPDLPDIRADRQRLLQVFDNLVGNAIKFTKPGGKITLAAAAREDEVLFTVADTGGGIAGYHLPHVFDRFWQAPQDKHPGAGLGLAIVKGIIEAHGGRIWVQSTPGQGSTFFFTIPMAASKATPSRAPALHGT